MSDQAGCNIKSDACKEMCMMLINLSEEDQLKLLDYAKVLTELTRHRRRRRGGNDHPDIVA